jgi:hypothetical protein
MPPWLPVLLVVVLTALALTAAGSSPVSATSKRLWMTTILLSGSLAIAGSVWQTRKAVEDTPALAGTTMSPQPAKKARVPPITQPTIEPDDRVRQHEPSRQIRTIPPPIAGELSAYLQPFGGRRVIVSCIPDDLEAYQYANQIVNILKEAKWDAHGPQQTRAFGDFRTPRINIFVNSADRSDTAKVLLEAFAKFNIPYQSRVTPSQAIPDAETIELFIGKLQFVDVSADGQ